MVYKTRYEREGQETSFQTSLWVHMYSYLQSLCTGGGGDCSCELPSIKQICNHLESICNSYSSRQKVTITRLTGTASKEDLKYPDLYKVITVIALINVKLSIILYSLLGQFRIECMRYVYTYLTS